MNTNNPFRVSVTMRREEDLKQELNDKLDKLERKEHRDRSMKKRGR